MLKKIPGLLVLPLNHGQAQLTVILRFAIQDANWLFTIHAIYQPITFKYHQKIIHQMGIYIYIYINIMILKGLKQEVDRELDGTNIRSIREDALSQHNEIS